MVTSPDLVRRIEHRVPGADADITSVLAAIVFGAYMGVKGGLTPPPETYGLAFHEDYALPKLITDFETAKTHFASSMLHEALGVF
jgi:glutamine synthetase